MKKLTLSHLLCIGVYLYTFCQDTLIFKNGDWVKAKISAIQHDMIRYKKWDNLNGPIYSEPKINISEVKYHDGSKPSFRKEDKLAAPAPAADAKKETINYLSPIGSMLDGKWFGDIYRNEGKDPYQVVLGCTFGENEFKVSYPELGCSGFWNVEKSSDTTVNFREHITIGKDSCADGLPIRLRIVNSNELECIIYTKIFKTVNARGELTRQ